MGKCIFIEGECIILSLLKTSSLFGVFPVNAGLVWPTYFLGSPGDHDAMMLPVILKRESRYQYDITKCIFCPIYYSNYFRYNEIKVFNQQS
jgi:hypothetical protein